MLLFQRCSRYNLKLISIINVLYTYEHQTSLMYLEEEVGFKKGKGGKYKHSIELHCEVEDANIDGLLEKATNEDDTPNLVVFGY